ncbi:MAG: DUF4230 domain-containing protein [Firmicutes bacterium]|nr:DUF4230 domain-containing protein [Bacillota bacterium]
MSKDQGRERLHITKTVKYMIAGIVLCVLLLGAGYLMGTNSDKGKTENLSAVVLQNQVTTMSELATITYTYTEMGQYESRKDFYGVTIPFTTNGFILTYDGIIKAGVDLGKTEVSVAGKTVKVTLPSPEILSHEIDEDSVKIFDEKTSIFNPFTVTDYTEFYADQKKEVEKKALAKGLLTEAKKQAKTVVEAALMDFLDEGYTLEIQ